VKALRGLGLALAVALGLAVAASASSEPPAIGANCDAGPNAADLTAAILVSADPTQLPDCTDADDFRGQPLTDADLAGLIGEIFFAFERPWTPTPTGTPTQTRTFTSTRTPTSTRTVTSTAPPTDTPTITATAAATDTPTSLPTSTASHTQTAAATATPTATRTITQTPTPTATAVPTGLAYRLSGRWAANWGNQVCFIGGQPFAALPDTVYTVTAVDGALDITDANGQFIGRGLQIQLDGTVLVHQTVNTGFLCPNNGKPLLFIFDYTFVFNLNRTGSAAAAWTYARDSSCETCSVEDSAALVKISGP
jgi:hypothetical protein